ncbi:hypothetical protein GCM10022261_21890 [Brevibacterium daeguense]|uniref:DUF222 domain-containing protein n=1 Tax=Brevibacterium daeguense TaxID=909936 RepID=A0ABP8EL26_9MICO
MPSCFDAPAGDPARLDEAASGILRTTAVLGRTADEFGAATASALEQLDGLRGAELFTFSRGALPLLRQLADSAHRSGLALRSHAGALASAQREIAALREQWLSADSERLTSGGAVPFAVPEQLELRAEDLRTELGEHARGVARSLHAAAVELEQARRKADRAGLIQGLRSALPPAIRRVLQDLPGLGDALVGAAGAGAASDQGGAGAERAGAARAAGSIAQDHPGSRVHPGELLSAADAWATREQHGVELAAMAGRIAAISAAESGALPAATSQAEPGRIDAVAAQLRIYPDGAAARSDREAVAGEAARAAALATGSWGSVA